MTKQVNTMISCESCGNAYPPETTVCPKCHTILAKPARLVHRTPAWVIVLLVLVILALVGYAVFLAWDKLVQHNY